MDIKHLETQYLKAKVAYYDGTPIMSDAAFDVLEKELKANGSKVIEQVGSKRKDFDFPHPTPMLSLSKIQTEENNYQEKEFESWLSKRFQKINESVLHMFYMPKFDGSAINIIYRNNTLESVLTRGDGKFGKDVTDRFVTYLPKMIELEGAEDIIEIRCEAVMAKSIFQKKYADKFANARNIVAGIIGKDDIDDEMIADLTLMPVQLLVNGKCEDLFLIKSITNDYPIFPGTYQIAVVPPTTNRYVEVLKMWEKNREEFNFQLDGVVFSLPYEYRQLLGENEHSPEWAIAIKFVPDEVVTPVIGIKWNLGKTGELTPVVCLKPVTLAGTTVKRASGYNAGYIINNRLGEGAFVDIHKSGDIIPEIGKIHNPGRVDELPKTCPACGETLTFDGIHLMCNNNECVGRIARKLGAAASMLDLKGIAGKTLEPFAEDFKNMYELFVWVLMYGNSAKKYKLDDGSLIPVIEAYGIKHGSRSHEIFVNAFKNIQSLTCAQVILMMGYDGVGRMLSEQVDKEYCGLEPDYKGHEKVLVEMFKDEDIRSYILNAVTVLESLGVSIDKPETKGDGKSTVYVCLTGSPKNFGFKTKEEFISQFSNVEEVSVTDAKCNYLITDDLNSNSGKMKAAEKKGVKIVTYENFKI